MQHSRKQEIQTAVESAQDQADQRRRAVRWGLVALGLSLLLLGLLLYGVLP
jgi:hypothetical protein